MNQEIQRFVEERRERISRQGANDRLEKVSREFMAESVRSQYSYNFSWMGRPVIQYPQDLLAMQEILWEVKPDLLIETGIAHGGSVLFYASMLELIGKGEVLAVDIDIRPHNRQAIETHPMYRRVTLIQGSSTDPDIVRRVNEAARGKEKILVTLDSNHSHGHVLDELKAYAPLVSVGSYLVVFDTVIEDLPVDIAGNRNWGPGNSPKSAVKAFLQDHPEFQVDRNIESKLQITVAPGGYLKRVR